MQSGHRHNLFALFIIVVSLMRFGGIQAASNILHTDQGASQAQRNAQHLVASDHSYAVGDEQWGTLGGGTNLYPYAMAFVGDTLFLGGSFFDQGAISKHLVQWDGSTWTTLASPFDDIEY